MRGADSLVKNNKLEACGTCQHVFDLDPQASVALWLDHRGDPQPAVVQAKAPCLPSLLSQARGQDAELAILDTAPQADAIASGAATHGDLILIPCRPSAFDLDAIRASIRLARSADTGETLRSLPFLATAVLCVAETEAWIIEPVTGISERLLQSP